MTPKEIRFPVQRLRNPIPRPLIWIGILLAMLLCFALFFHPASLGNVVRDFSTTEKVHIVNYYTVATSHLPPQKEGELSFSYTDTEKQEAFLEILAGRFQTISGILVHLYEKKDDRGGESAGG